MSFLKLVKHNNKIRWVCRYVLLAANNACSHDRHSFGATLKSRHTSFDKFLSILTCCSELWKQIASVSSAYSVLRLAFSEASTHPVESDRRYKRHPRHEGIRHLSVLRQKFLPPAGVRALLYRLQVHGYTLGACIHYFYRVDVILDHASHKLQSHRWVLNDVDGASVYDVRLTLDRSVLAHELVPVVCPHRLYRKSNASL